MTPVQTSVASRWSRLYHRVGRQVDRLREWCDRPDAELIERAPEISGWSPAEHLEHLAITGSLVLDTIGRARRPDAPRRGPKLSGWAVLATGRIPRGRAKARREWCPERPDPERARAGIAAFADRFAALEPELPAIVAARGTAPHPVLGGFTPGRWLRFLEIHQNHHLAIADDVRRRARSRPVGDG